MRTLHRTIRIGLCRSPDRTGKSELAGDYASPVVLATGRGGAKLIPRAIFLIDASTFGSLKLMRGGSVPHRRRCGIKTDKPNANKTNREQQPMRWELSRFIKLDASRKFSHRDCCRSDVRKEAMRVTNRNDARDELQQCR